MSAVAGGWAFELMRPRGMNRSSHGRPPSCLVAAAGSAAVLVEWWRVFQRAGWDGKPAVVGRARETAGGNKVERLLQIRSDRCAAARAPTGSDPPAVLMPPAV